MIEDHYDGKTQSVLDNVTTQSVGTRGNILDLMQCYLISKGKELQLRCFLSFVNE